MSTLGDVMTRNCIFQTNTAVLNVGDVQRAPRLLAPQRFQTTIAQLSVPASKPPQQTLAKYTEDLFLALGDELLLSGEEVDHLGGGFGNDEFHEKTFDEVIDTDVLSYYEQDLSSNATLNESGSDAVGGSRTKAETHEPGSPIGSNDIDQSSVNAQSTATNLTNLTSSNGGDGAMQRVPRARVPSARVLGSPPIAKKAVARISKSQSNRKKVKQKFQGGNQRKVDRVDKTQKTEKEKKKVVVMEKHKVEKKALVKKIAEKKTALPAPSEQQDGDESTD